MTDTPTFKEYHLRSRPNDMPTIDNFELHELPLPILKDGEVKVRNLWMSVDPYMRGRMRPGKSYAARYEVGEVMHGGAIGIVEESRSPEFIKGAIVRSMCGWREAFVASASALSTIPEDLGPPEAHLGALGMPGLTAYYGLFEIAKLKPGERVFVSAAAGAVGSMVCQIAKSIGCVVIGSAGSDEKCTWLRDILGVDATINYRMSTDLSAAIEQAAPDGIDVYFENVGGEHFAAALGNMAEKGRIVACGMIAAYNDTGVQALKVDLSPIVVKSLRIEGFIATQHYDFYPAFYDFVRPLLAAGNLHWQQTISVGIESAPNAFLGLFSGVNKGKMLVKLG